MTGTNPIKHTRHIGLGYTAEGYRVVATVELRRDDPPREVTFTDHSTGISPEDVGIMFEVFDPRGGRDRGSISAGQTSPEDRVIVRRHESDASEQTREVIEQAWERWHLNTMHAECVHMTEEMLNPADDVLDAYIAENTTGRRFYGRLDALQSYRLDRVTCPETGYRYGRQWLAEALPEETARALHAIIETGNL